MSLWTEDEARAYFESGGEDLPKPPPSCDPVLSGLLEEAGLSHLTELLISETLDGLVELMKTDRASFLPHLKEIGIKLLPERQAIRDIVKNVANPPMGSKMEFLVKYKDELAKWPWTTVEAEKFIVEGDADIMVSRPSKKLRKYMVRDSGCKAPTKGREVLSGTIMNGTVPDLVKGTIVVGDDESWACDSPDLRVHIYIPNTMMDNGTYFQGWVNFMEMTPLQDDESPIPCKEKSEYAEQRQIQHWFERGYKQVSFCRAANEVMKSKDPTMNTREALNPLWLKVRGPALAYLGFKPTMKGLDAFMASRIPEEELDRLMTDEDYVALTDAHNRIVMMMQGMSPARIPDAMATRGKKVVDETYNADEAAGEEGEVVAEEGGEEAEGGGKAEGAPSAT
eukprot:CAMPEP_0119336890 /NCGR_PEP_ID=MMETSP1333-20130426/92880_1 /TAXON_ID=418940 /ORGANISM="Scyphosphaera apsteinii, Strain RCC1455" /LENGTH=394 /DNA_ID=CAMNT_0007347809 /DNA_START=83 /DNA_END=1267 /DNA_ORIENTATION=+